MVDVDKSHAGKEMEKGKFGPKSGRIGRLEEQTLGYYRRVSESLSEGFETPEDKELFIKNVFTQLCTEAIKVSQNQTASRIIEDLLGNASTDQLLAFMEEFSKDWETVCTDRFASYVTQTLIMLTAQHMKDKTETSEKMKSVFLELYSFLMSHLGMYMQDTYGSHILRVALEVLGGVRVADSIIRSRTSKSFDKGKGATADIKLPEPGKKFLKRLDEIGHKIMAFPKLEEFAKNYLSNPVLQTLLLVLGGRKPESVTSMLNTLITSTDMFKCRGDSVVPDLVANDVSSHLVEQVFKLASEDLMCDIYEKYLKGKLVHFAMHPTANFVLQTFIKNIKSPEQFEEVFDELAEYLEDVLAENHLGVIVAIADAAIVYSSKQKSLIEALQKAFHCHEPEERQSKLVPLLASLTTYEVFYKIPESDDDEDDSGKDSDEEFQLPTLKKINYHGSVLLQKLLKHKNPSSIVSGLSDLKPVELQLMACDPCGSHIIEELVRSQTVREKSREAFYNRLKGHYIEIACHKNGSRTMDALWNAAPLKVRINLAEELVKQEAKLKGHRFGFFIWRNYALHHFQHRRQEWKEIQNGQLKKRKLFQDLISSDKQEPVSKKKKAEGSKEEGNDSELRLQMSEEEEENPALEIISSPKPKKSKKKDIEKKKSDSGDMKSSKEGNELSKKQKSKKKKKKKAVE